MSLMSEIAYRIARRRVLSRSVGDPGENPATYSAEAYQQWRESELVRQFRDHFTDVDLRGLDVLDFGCGEGDLAFFVAKGGPRSVVGIDAMASRVEVARRRAARASGAPTPRFSVASRLDAIDLPGASVDVILCFDVLEHVMRYEAIIGEWRRVLRPGGRILIWWVPWLHPYGHHLEILLPIPWAHVVFSDRALIDACARLYDMPEFRPRPWDVDEAGNKKPNKWRTMDRLPDVNRLTIAAFEATLRRVGLATDRRDIRGFGYSAVARLTNFLTHVPWLREYFSSYLVYRLRR